MTTETQEQPNCPVEQQWSSGSGAHRLINHATGEFTDWADYTSFTYLDGWVGHTAYFGTTEGVVTPDAFCRLAAVQKAVEDDDTDTVTPEEEADPEN